MPDVALERESLLKMVGEALREIGLLYLVFGVLDAQIEARKMPAKPADFRWFAEVVCIGVIIWAFGAAAEKFRRE